MRDHPRMRGEHMGDRASERPCVGSSPHARGAQLPMEAGQWELGIIPACAGSTVPQKEGFIP